MLFPLLAAAILILQNAPALASAPSDYDDCVRSLHAIGGMSQWSARITCLAKPTDKVLACQNHRFLLEFRPAAEAYRSCLANPGPAAPESEQLYHGSYEPIPTPSHRKTICSITVNSEDERDAFRSQLDPASHSWVELLPHNAPGMQNRFIVRDQHWLNRACSKQIKCDALVISGHFAASFIGSAGFDVKLEDLSRASCRNDCSNFFESVRDVYLFGCNTLATRDLDTRTIEQYVEILVQDGVGPHEAQRIAARRYTSYGRSIRDEMLTLFPNAVNVFGYPSVGPTGKGVKPTLISYLRGAYRSSHERSNLPHFSRTLAKTGMIRLPSRPKQSGQCAPAPSLFVDQTLKSADGIRRYVHQYGTKIPVPAADLIREGTARGLLTHQEAEQLKWKLVAKLQSEPSPFRRLHHLCPFLLSGHSELVRQPELCQQDTSWLCSLADTREQCAARRLQ